MQRKVKKMAKVDHKPSQNERILKYMDEHGSITQYEAMMALGVMRLASRISDLRRLGYPIVSEFETVRNRHEEECRIKRYRLSTEGENGTNGTEKADI